MPNRVGQQLGNYRLLRLLGRGGFAEVYLGEHVYLKRRAAVKVLHTSLDDEEVDHFLAEGQTLARLTHPHIVRVFDFAVEQGTPFLVMDYAPRGTLRQRHPRGSCLSLVTTVTYVTQVAAALQYAHTRQVIHRDVKPENILLGSGQQVLLSDFGLALFSSSPDQLSTQEKAGTIPYMAPEQLRGKPGFASDQYALGIVVYEWLCGVRPFEGDQWQIAYQHTSVPPPPLRDKDPSLPQAIEEVVLKALAKDPKERYASVQQFAQALQQASGASPLAVGPDEEVEAMAPLDQFPSAPTVTAKRVFVSASSADEAFVARLSKDLQQRGIVVRQEDPDRTQNNLDQQDGVRQAIRDVEVVLVVLSPAARASRTVKEHLRIANLYQRRLVFVWAAGEEIAAVLPEEWGRTVQIDLIDAREERYQGALDQLLACLQEDTVLEVSTSPEPAFEPRNPYKGLRAFTQDDTDDFFGRDSFTQELVDQVKGMLTSGQPGTPAARLLTVIGPSGSGKSSVVMARLLPRLQRGALSGSQEWVYLEPMVPGTHPLEALVLTLAPHFPDRSLKSLREDLQDESTRGLHLLSTQLVKTPGQQVVLFVDQFEELFNLTISEDERQHVIDLLLTAITEPGGPLLLLVTLRADCYERPMRYPTLSRLMQTHLQQVFPMEVQDLRSIIKGPAALPDVQLSFEGSLVGDLLFEVQGQVGALPLLQFTLEQLFQRRNGRQLTLSAYRELGGVKGALTRQAEETYTTLPSEEHRKLARALFVRLIDPGATEQDTTRRRAALSEFTLDDPTQTRLLRETIDTFIAARLLTTNEIAGTTTIEVSHEALIREWPRLAGWLREAREDIPLQQAISEDVTEWERHGKPRDRLYRGSQLKEARAWAKRNMPSRTEVAFLRASVANQTRSRVSATALALLLVLMIGLVVQLLSQPKPSVPNPTMVTTLKDTGPGSLRQAIVAAKPGDTITFDAGLRGTIMLMSEDLNITKSLDIHGPDAGKLSISGGDRNLRVSVFADASVTISGLSFKDNKATSVCLITNYGTLTLTNSMISGNRTFPGTMITPAGPISCRGGGIDNEGMLELTNSIVSGNTGPSGGIFNDGTLTITNSTVSDNTASGDGNSGTYSGGGIFNGGTLALINSTVSGNMASQGDGGGIWNGEDTERAPRPPGVGGRLTLTNSTVSGNSATGNGGGIYNDGTLTITDSTISGNMASDSGGGIYNGRSSIVNGMPIGGMLTLINSTVSDNRATSHGGGMVFSGTQANITFCTIYSNKAAHDGGGISIQDFNFNNNVTRSQVEMRNSIVVANRAHTGHDILGTLTSDGYNLFQDNAGATFDPATSKQHGTDKTVSVNDLTKLFAAPVGLQNNGGPTRTYALGPDSPAIDAIPLQYCQIKGILNSRSGRYTDQPGMKRPDGNEQFCDIGAYEYVDSG